ncbi:MAG: hypothetical protein A4E72_01209 [Syntrophus sp. PtaU1.Bin208]|nr:MAG: hypothetical protein A4E72_01209 [Syntrophus sp. PtaU1.Bin208]
MECTVCKHEAEKAAKMNFDMLDGREIKIKICEKCANKIDENLFFIIICRGCGAVLWMENIEKEKVSIKVQDECPGCVEPAEASSLFPMV